MYRKYVNVLVADEYELGRVINSNPDKSKIDQELLGLFWGDLSSDEKSSRVIEKLDHFIAGTGLEVDKDGLFSSVPEKLKEYIERRASEPLVQENEIYRGINKNIVSAEQAKKLAEIILKKSGFIDDVSPWKAVVQNRKNTLAVIGGKKEIRIPDTFERGLVDTLVVLSHEIEGHVLRHINQKKSVGSGLKLINEKSPGRGGILSEAAAMRIEDETKQEMVGMKREALPYYYQALMEKQRGGSFKECFRTFIESYVDKNYVMSLDEAIKSDVFDEAFKYSYDRVLRIFRRNTPLGDTSGYLPTTDQLEYIEQELVVDTLKGTELENLLYINGIDLYSLGNLKKLGMLDLSNAQGPKMVVAREVWPMIKQGLDQKKPLDEILAEMMGV